MLASEIEDLISLLPIVKNSFRGCLPLDMWPKKLEEGQFFISNTKPSNHPGAHWFVVHKSSDRDIEIFDCLVASRNLLDQISKYKCRISMNKQPFMKRNCNLCGAFCVYFAINRIFHPVESLNEILEDFFSPDVNDNERRVRKFQENLTWSSK